MALNISNPSEIEVTSNSYDDLPDGKYKCRLELVEDEERTSQTGNTYQQVKLKMKVGEGDHENRVIFSNCIYDHPNPAAAQIGVEKLKKLYDALECQGPLTPSSLMSSSRCVLVTLWTPKEGKNGYDPRQNVVDFAKCGSCEGACPSHETQAEEPVDNNEVW